MVDGEGLGAGRRRGLMAIMEWMRGVDTISLKGRGGRVAGRSGRIGGGGSRGQVVGRRAVGRSDSSKKVR